MTRTSLILNGSQEALFNALKILDKFANISGLNINSTKTKVIWIGSKKYSAQVYHHVKWKLNWGETEFSLLGIDFHVNLNEIITINFNKAITKIENLLKQWEKRRITVLKTIIIPKLNHLFISLPNPDQHVISMLKTKFYNFIWKSKIDRIKRNVLNGGYDIG